MLHLGLSQGREEVPRYYLGERFRVFVFLKHRLGSFYLLRRRWGEHELGGCPLSH